MKAALIVMLAILAGLFSGVGQASIGSASPPYPGTLVLLGSGMVGVAVWARRKMRK